MAKVKETLTQLKETLKAELLKKASGESYSETTINETRAKIDFLEYGAR